LSAPKSAATLKLEEAVGQLTTVFAQALLASTKAAYSRRPES
jgi:hypothetical protein